ncbi:hypothetical protein [Halobellus ruber]|uniref:Uncharacterized protein n=1 Tax=Halobellus ruber TaxID=2761102 RepID=A0A7J9SIP4_9EURY|nr:hypothetical protein [Halobellus ruber]MBB6646382.1 hypothetical protein [Halobellus ruber]
MILVAAALWLMAWGFVGVSIIVATTSGAPAGAVDAVVQGVGEFYLTAVATLRQFALSTTVSPRWVDVGYAALATVPIFIHLFLLSGVISVYTDDAAESPGLVLLFTLGLPLSVGALIGSAVFYLGAQLLTLSTIGVGVVLVPFAYAFVRA